LIFVSTGKQGTTQPPLSRAEQETETAAERLNAQIEAALAAVAIRTSDGVEELEACADRLERAARDLAVALRELAEQRQNSKDEG
jgi:ABC-type transporter Mla subunit MlaD